MNNQQLQSPKMNQKCKVRKDKPGSILDISTMRNYQNMKTNILPPSYPEDQLSPQNLIYVSQIPKEGNRYHKPNQYRKHPTHPINHANAKIGQTKTAPIVEKGCRQDETDAKNIAVMPVAMAHTVNEKAPSVTLANSNRHTTVSIDGNENNVTSNSIQTSGPFLNRGTTNSETLANGRRHHSIDAITSEAIGNAGNDLNDLFQQSPTNFEITGAQEKHFPPNNNEVDKSDTGVPNLLLRNCQYCGKAFQARRASRKYCSNVCRVYAHYVRHGGRKCRVCGQPTPCPNRSVCSEACRAQLPYYQPGCYEETTPSPSVSNFSAVEHNLDANTKAQGEQQRIVCVTAQDTEETSHETA